METLWQDVRGGLWILARSPGFATVTVLTLAASPNLCSLFSTLWARSIH